MTREQIREAFSCKEKVLLDVLKQISEMTTGREETEQMVFSDVPKWFVEDLKQVRMHNSSVTKICIYWLFLPSHGMIQKPCQMGGCQI